MIETVAFEAYGCIQVALRPTTLKEDGTSRDGQWFDISRLEIKSKIPITQPKNFFDMPIRALRYDQGPSDKTTIRSSKMPLR